MLDLINMLLQASCAISHGGHYEPMWDSGKSGMVCPTYSFQRGEEGVFPNVHLEWADEKYQFERQVFNF